MKEERFLAGTDAAGVRQGQMSLAMARKIIEEEGYVLPGEKTRRVEKMIEEDFPGLEINFEIDVENILPLVRYGSQLYQTLVRLYKGQGLPDHVKSAFLMVCFHLAGLVSLNPNSIWALWSENILQDCIALPWK